MAGLTCPQCGNSIEPRDGGRLPPWCLACGVDLNGYPPRAVPSPSRANEPSPAEEAQWRDRFGMHNVAVGLLLFVWGAVISAVPPQSGGDKVLAAERQLQAVVDALQVATLLNGVALVISGVALRRGWRWGYPLAVVCAVVSVMAGGVFLAGFRHLGGGDTLDHGVARLSFVRYNFDMLIGLVDGLGLLWFLSTRVMAGPSPSAGRPAAQVSQPPSTVSHR